MRFHRVIISSLRRTPYLTGIAEICSHGQLIATPPPNPPIDTSHEIIERKNPSADPYHNPPSRFVRSSFLSRSLSCPPEGRFCVFCGKKISSQVDTAWMKPRANQPQNLPPCPRARAPCEPTGGPVAMNCDPPAFGRPAPGPLRVIEPQMPQIRLRRHGSTQMKLPNENANTIRVIRVRRSRIRAISGFGQTYRCGNEI